MPSSLLQPPSFRLANPGFIIGNPKLTTVSQDCFELGCSTVEYLLEKIRQPSTPIRKVFLRSELIIRETV